MWMIYKIFQIFFVLMSFTNVYGNTKKEYLKIIDDLKKNFVNNRTYELDGKIYYKSNDELFSGVIVIGEIETPLFLIEVQNGVKHGKEFRFYGDGELRSIEERKGGLLAGVCIGWYSNGSLEFRREYANGMKHGKHETWYESGIKEYEMNYFNDKLTSPFFKWFKNGNILFKKELHENGSKIVSTKYFMEGTIEEVRIDEVRLDKIIVKKFEENGCIISLRENLNGEKKLEYIFDSSSRVRLINKYAKGGLVEKQVFDFDKKERKKIIYDKDFNISSEELADFLILKYVDGELKHL